MTNTTGENPLHDITLPIWVHWLAQDADGTWWGFEVEPLPHHQGWYENEVGRRVRLRTEGVNPDWLHSLIRVNT